MSVDHRISELGKSRPERIAHVPCADNGDDRLWLYRVCQRRASQDERDCEDDENGMIFRLHEFIYSSSIDQLSRWAIYVCAVRRICFLLQANTRMTHAAKPKPE